MRLRVLSLLALLAAAPAWAQPQWTVATPLPSPRTGAAVATLGGYIYVIGGRDASGYPIDTAIRYDPSTGEWSNAGTLDHGRANGAAFVLNGRVMVIGGRREDGNVMDDIEEYDPINNIWFENSQCTNEREGHAAFAIGNVAFAFGGTAEGGGYLGDAEWYQYGQLFWELYPEWSLAIPRASFASAPAGDGALVVGGYSTFGPLADVEYYVPGIGGVARAELPAPRGGLGGATLETPDGQRVYVAGGRDASNAVVTSVDIYDPVADSWSPGPALPAPREGASVVAVNGRMYVIGGRDGTAATATTFVLDVSTAAEGGPEQGSLALGAPTPNPAAGEASLALRVTGVGAVRVEAYDALGRRVAILHDGLLGAGDHELRWTGRDESGAALTSGIYLVRARQGDQTATRRLTVTR